MNIAPNADSLVKTLLVLTLLPLLGGCGLPSASEEFTQTHSEASVRPAARTVEHDFGIMPVSTKRTHTFRIENSTSQTWKIADIRSSCGCTVAQPDRKQAAPGEALEIAVEYHSPTKSRDDRQKITVRLEHGGGLVLEVRARVRTPIVFARSRYDLNVAPGRRESSHCSSKIMGRRIGPGFLSPKIPPKLNPG